MRRDKTKENKTILVAWMKAGAITSHEVAIPEGGRRDVAKPE
jgi:hypothetical protein